MDRPTSPNPVVQEEKPSLSDGGKATPMDEKPSLETPRDEIPTLEHSSGPKALQEKNVGRKAVLTVVAAYVLAVALALAHHFMQASINGHRINTSVAKYSPYSQYWIKNLGNIFAKGVAICLSIVVTIALTQVNWHAIRSKYTPIGLINELFSLPSPLATVQLVTRFRENPMRWMPSLMLALLINAMFLVSTFAPVALTTGPPLTVPVPQLDPATFTNTKDAGFWNTLIPHMISLEPYESWIVPQDCKSTCTFSINYTAPSLRCTSLSAQEVGTNLTAYNVADLSTQEGWPFYWSPNNVSMTWGINNQPLEIYYRLFSVGYGADAAPSTNPGGTLGGQRCQYEDGVYQAFYNYHLGKANVTTVLLPDESLYARECTWEQPDSLSPRCKAYARTAALIGNGFNAAFAGSLIWRTIGVDNALQNYIQIQPYIDFVNNTATHTISLSTPPANLSQTLEIMFQNVTLGALLQYTPTFDVSASVYAEDGSVWVYSPRILWAFYTPALVLALCAAIYGFYDASVNGVHLYWNKDSIFSAFFIASRSKDLDAISIREHSAFKHIQLKYDDAKGSFVINRDSMPHDDREEAGNQSQVKTTQTWARLIMLLTFLLAFGIAHGHHGFAKRMDHVNAMAHPQAWIRGASNTFANVVAILLGISALLALNQANWRALRFQKASLHDLDSLFGLPSMKSTLAAVFSVRSMQLFYAILIAIGIQALALVSTLAPNALGVSPGYEELNELTIPQLNFSAKNFAGVNDPAVYWGNLITDLQSESNASVWDVPDKCDQKCSFSVDYAAPALTCRDMRTDEITLDPNHPAMTFNDSWRFYNVSDTSILSAPRWEGDGTLGFYLEYMPVTFIAGNGTLNIQSNGPPAGSYCHCLDGTYHTTFLFANNTKAVGTDLTSSSNALSTACDWDNVTANSDCGIYAANSLSVCKAFAENLAHALEWDAGYVETENSVKDRLLLDKLFNYASNVTGDGLITFSLKVDNLTTGMDNLFNTMVAGFLPKLQQTTTINATVWDGESIWKFDVFTLWIVYGPAFGIMAIVIAYSFWCIYQAGIGMDTKFSTFMVSTRSDDLDTLYENAKDYDDLMSKPLVYDKDGRFILSPKEDSKSKAS